MRDLLLHPQATIARLLDEDFRPWLLPWLGYSLMSWLEASDRINRHFDSLGLLFLLVVAMAACTIGAASWGLVLGGILHLMARLFGGRRGLAKSIRAVGYGLVWPGMVGGAAKLGAVIVGDRGGDVPMLAVPFLLLQLAAGLWAIYTMMAAMRARHGLPWWRTVVAFLIPGVALVGLVMVVVFVYLLLLG